MLAAVTKRSLVPWGAGVGSLSQGALGSWGGDPLCLVPPHHAPVLCRTHRKSSRTAPGGGSGQAVRFASGAARTRFPSCPAAPSSCLPPAPPPPPRPPHWLVGTVGRAWVLAQAQGPRTACADREPCAPSPEAPALLLPLSPEVLGDFTPGDRLYLRSAALRGQRAQNSQGPTWGSQLFALSGPGCFCGAAVQGPGKGTGPHVPATFPLAARQHKQQGSGACAPTAPFCDRPGQHRGPGNAPGQFQDKSPVPPKPNFCSFPVEMALGAQS